MAPQFAHLSKGSILHHGNYRIERVLGQGGFGITYLATDLSLDRKVAIKEFFPKDYCNRDETTSHITIGEGQKDFIDRLKAKFLKEARNIAKFDCPYIIKIHAAFEDNNTAYYVMEYIDGCSLSEMVKATGSFTEQQAVYYIDKIGQALEYIHARRINHLDVKPANIMVRRSDNQPILIDFGLSKQYDSEGHQTSTTPTGISHGYAPMEQYNDGGVSDFSPQTDVYSLAATLYYLVSGSVPPKAMDLLNDGLAFPVDFPGNLIDPITKAMSPVKKSRYETVITFLNEIKNVTLERKDGLNDNTKFYLTDKSAQIQSPTNSIENLNIPQNFNDKKRNTKKFVKLLVLALICIFVIQLCSPLIPGLYFNPLRILSSIVFTCLNILGLCIFFKTKSAFYKILGCIISLAGFFLLWLCMNHILFFIQTYISALFGTLIGGTLRNIKIRISDYINVSIIVFLIESFSLICLNIIFPHYSTLV